MAKITLWAIALLCFAPTLSGQDGTADTSFGNGGTVQTDIDNDYDYASSILELSNGLLVGGSTKVNDMEYPLLVRYFNDGTVDTAFGDNGVVVNMASNNEGAYIFLAEHIDATLLAGNYANNLFQLTRYLPNGTIDLSFANGGTLIPLADGLPGRPVILNNNKILVVSVGDRSGMLELVTQRYMPDGSNDNSYGTDGIVRAPVGLATSGVITDVTTSEGNSLYVLLDSFLATNGGYQLVKVQADGQLDPGYGEFGIAETLIDPDFSVKSITKYPDGKIAVLCSKFFEDPSRYENYIVQHLPSGQPNTDFGSQGVLDIPGDNLTALTILAQPNGRLLLYGELTDFFEGGGRTVLRRYFENGSEDSSISLNTVLNPEYFARTMLLQDDGKIVCLGTSAWYNGDPDIVMERYENSPLGVEEHSPSSISVSPNPSNGIFTLSSQTADMPNMPYSIYDISGKIIRAGIISSQHTSIDISDVASGVYFLKVQGSVYRLLRM
jgi:uncharacterized delta-60 repeat protein